MNDSTTLKIYGAGSIGIIDMPRSKQWDVTICDIDQQALDRTKMKFILLDMENLINKSNFVIYTLKKSLLKVLIGFLLVLLPTLM